MESLNNLLTTEQLAIESAKVLKMLQRKPMPYKWRLLQQDTEYNFVPRNQILANLKELNYVEDFDLNSITLTKKGRKFKSLRRETLKKWYKELPENNWLLADALKYFSIAVIGGVLGSLITLQCNHPKKQSKSVAPYSDSLKKT